MSSRTVRRDFLKAGALVGAGVWSGVGPAVRAEGPNEKLNVAVIGLGGQGSPNLNGISSQNVVALCDVDDERAGKAYEKFPQAKKFYDFRTMYDELEKEIDVVVISTPDHTHFHPAYMAMRMGKHVYLEKPMAHSVREARILTDLAAKKKVATQLGVQRHTIEGMHRTVELVKAGAIGKIKEVHSWVGGSRGMPSTNIATPPVPAHLKWDLWLGPAAERPYSPDLCPYKWRFWWDFGTGEAGNWGCHILDIPFWALDLKYPTRVDVSNATPHAQTTPKSLSSRFEFPAVGDRPPVVLHWYHGTPPILAELKLDGKNFNNLFIGTDGMLLAGFTQPKLLPEDKYKDFVPPAKSIPKSPGFHKEFITACKGGPPSTCDFSYSGPMSETVLLANAAYRAGGGFEWDAATLTAKGNPNVDPFLMSHFRKGWELESL